MPLKGVLYGITAGNVGRLKVVSPEGESASVHYLGMGGELLKWDGSVESGPLLFEDQTYHFWAIGQSSPPEVEHRDPLFAQNIISRPAYNSSSGTFNLRRQIGTLAFEVVFGAHRIKLELEVAPSKIDYKADYTEMVSKVASLARGMALAYMRSTTRKGAHNEQIATEIEWVTTLRQELKSLAEAIQAINCRPYRQLNRELSAIRNYRLNRLDSTSRRAIMSLKGTGPFDDVGGIGPVRRNVQAVSPAASLDTPEHRWVKFHLSQLRMQLQDIEISIRKEVSNTPKRVGERRIAEQREINGFVDELGRLLEVESLRLAGNAPPAGPPSLTLLSAPGYRDAYRILTELRLGLSVGGEVLDLQIKDIHQLFEIWAFLEVVRIVSSCLRVGMDPASLVSHYRGGLRVNLRSGRLSEVVFGRGAREVTVTYNQVFPGQTGDQKPDIVIRIRAEGSPELVIVLDAKYRVDARSEFRKRYGAPGPPIDAINALHRYRDAIVVSTPDLFRPVVRGAALFPLTFVETSEFEQRSTLYEALGQLGVGALPFLPGNTKLVERWLEEILNAPISELAWNGPPTPGFG